MCSCHRDNKPHSDACRAAHRRYNKTPTGYVRGALYEITQKRARAERDANRLGVTPPWLTN